ncbi:MAG: class I SAM-dependent methyltransferase [Cyanobacteria bacterium P01_G01_bin.19]
MAILENPILLPFLRLIVGALIGKDNLNLYDTVDWQQESDRFVPSNYKYPQYYARQNFHGIEGGYLNAIAPVTYDVVTRFAAPPSEERLRQQAISRIENQPQRILDLGCGTGSSTIALKRKFPQARVTGLDLSPHMLVMAEQKAKKANLTVDWQQGLAEANGFSSNSFDLISIAFLFHETPVHITRQILKECQRLLEPGGQLIVLDGNQKRLRHTPWLIQLFREPYSSVYAAGDVDHWLEEAGLIRIKTQPVGWISQLSTCFKPVQSSVS